MSSHKGSQAARWRPQATIKLPDMGSGRMNPDQEFDLLEKLGEGSYGSVWKALHKSSGKVVAVKKNDLEGLIREIDILKQCSSPYIIKYYGSYFHQDDLWIVMEFAGGGSVADIMRLCDRPLDEVQIQTVCSAILNGLSYLHGQRKVHRDLKAGNVILTNDGDTKVCDFGVSGQISDNYAKRNTVIGTPFWMAPEVIQEVGYDYKCDIWSLGITAIEMAQMYPPHHETHPMRAIFMIPSKPPPRLTEPSKWSDDFNDFVAQCLVKDPDARPTADDLLKHPFIAKCTHGPEVLVSLIDESIEHIASAGGREAALGIDDSDDDDGAMATMQGGTALGFDGCSTMVIDGDDGTEYGGTMVMQASPRSSAASNSSAGRDSTSSAGAGGAGGGGGGGTPQFQKLLSRGAGSVGDGSRDSSGGGGGGASASAGTKADGDLTKLSMAELKQLLKDLDADMEKEMGGIRHRYADYRKIMENASNK